MFGDDRRDGGEGADGRGDVVSVVGPGMEIEGDCRCEGSLRVDGRVHGTIRAGKSVVVGQNGQVEGDVVTQDAVVAGHVVGSIHAESRLELKGECRVEGDIRSPSIRLEEGGHVDGELDMSGEEDAPSPGDGGREGPPSAVGRGEPGKPEAVPDAGRPQS